MKTRLGFSVVCALFIAAPVCAQDVTTAVVSQSQYIAGAGLAGNPSLRFLGKDSAGRLIVLNQNLSSNADFKLLRVDITNPVPVITVLATGADLLGAITTAGGTAPASVTIRGMGVAANDNVILGSDDAAAAYLFRVTGPNAVQLLSGLQTNSPMDGLNGLVVVGNTACALIEQAFVAVGGNVTDHVQAFDITATANGNQAGTEVATAANIYAAIGGGAADANVRLLVGTAVSANEIVVANSSGAAATDELIKVNVSTNAVTLAKSKASQLSDLSGDTDVGYNSMTLQASNNTIYLWNNFGGTADDDIVAVTAGGTGTASVFVTDTAVEADAQFTGNGGTALNISNAGMITIGNWLLWNEFTTGQTFKMTLPGSAAVADWNVY